MLRFITTDFTDRFKKLDRKIADIYIKHILFGKQIIRKCILHPFIDEDCIGLIINDEKIYVTMAELYGVDINDNGCIIKSEVMELSIVL